MPGWQDPSDAALIASAEYVFKRLYAPLIERWVATYGTAAAEGRLALAISQLRAASLLAGSGAIAAGAIPVISMAGVFVALGAGYQQAREEAREVNYRSGFSQGFVMGILKWSWHQAWIHFGKKEVGTNAWDQGISVAAYEGYNRGLVAGFQMGDFLPEDAKKAFRIRLRNLADRHDSGPWSGNSDTAYLQQRDYVIELAAAGLKDGVLKVD